MRPLVILLAAIGLAAGLVACGGDDGGDDGAQTATPAPEQPAGEQEASPADPNPAEAFDIASGETRITLAPQLMTALEVAGVEIEPLGGAERGGDTIAVPISGGRFDLTTEAGRIEHAGGVAFASGDRRVEATELAILPHDDLLTGMVEGRRVPLFAVDLGEPQAGNGGAVTAQGDLAVADGSALDRLGIDVIGAGVRVGELSVEARR